MNLIVAFTLTESPKDEQVRSGDVQNNRAVHKGETQIERDSDRERESEITGMAYCDSLEKRKAHFKDREVL